MKHKMKVRAVFTVFYVYSDVAATKTHVLRIEMSGRFAVNVVDNLIVVHHQSSKVLNPHFAYLNPSARHNSVLF